jgi:hypothetical protein
MRAPVVITEVINTHNNLRSKHIRCFKSPVLIKPYGLLKREIIDFQYRLILGTDLLFS